MIKLVEPTDKSSPAYWSAQRGGGIHHICFRCNNIDTDLKRFKVLGHRILSEPRPGEAFGGERIAFFLADHGLNIELIDTKKKANRLRKRK